MTARIAILCPGQGGQDRHMFDLARADPTAARALDGWLDRPTLAATLDNEQALFCNLNAQPLIVAATLAAWQAIKSALPAPSVVAGYSIGELAAYGVAGALHPQDAVNLAAVRARLMDECVHASAPQAVAAVSGLRAAALGDVLTRFDLHIAIQNSDDAFIIGGLVENLDRCTAALAGQGGKPRRLPVAIAAHTACMQSAVAPFRAALEQVRFGDPSYPVVAGISAELVYRKEAAIDVLSRQLAQTIRWAECMDACVEAGVTLALELGPGSALTRMLRERHPGLECRSVADFRSLEGVRAWLGRQADGF